MGVMSRSLSERLRRTLIMCVAVAVSLFSIALVPSSSSAVGRVRVIGPQSNFAAAVSSLRPGDTLQLLPGTYSIGLARFYAGPFVGRTGNFVPGTAAAPITITAASPSDPPLLRGLLSFQGGDHVVLSYLRVEATILDSPALRMTDGIGWTVRNCEFFGARNSHGLANVEIGGGVNPARPGQPSRFQFLYNSVHDASNSPASLHPDRVANHSEHNIYVYFHGSAGSGGLIQRNLIWGHPNGAGIKLGDGGVYNARGPWNVTVAFNTIAGGGRQILLHGDVRSNKIVGNLLWRATQTFVHDPRTTQIYLHEVTGRGNYVRYNYAFGSSMFMFDVKHPFALQLSIVANAANRLSAAKASDPHLTAINQVNGWLATNPAVAAYGRYGNGRF